MMSGRARGGESNQLGGPPYCRISDRRPPVDSGGPSARRHVAQASGRAMHGAGRGVEATWTFGLLAARAGVGPLHIRGTRTFGPPMMDLRDLRAAGAWNYKVGNFVEIAEPGGIWEDGKPDAGPVLGQTPY